MKYRSVQRPVPVYTSFWRYRYRDLKPWFGHMHRRTVNADNYKIRIKQVDKLKQDRRTILHGKKLQKRIKMTSDKTT